MRVTWRMLFKVGLTVIVLVAVYMYYALQNIDSGSTYTGGDNSVVGDGAVAVDDGKVEQSSKVGKEIDGNIPGKAGEDGVHLDGVKPIDQKEFEDLDKADGSEDDSVQMKKTRSSHWQQGIHIAVVCCGDRLEEVMVMFKSAVLFAKLPLVFHIFAEDELHKPFREQLDFWPPKYRLRVEYHIYNLSFPLSDNPHKPDEWKLLFKPCASQRLFIPTLLPDVDSVLYVDTDILFLSPVDNIWSMFSKFNSTQLAALSPEHEDRAVGWYNRFARHPYYGELGVNSGVMLMNLTRLRTSTWLQSMNAYIKEYRLKITWGDQDLINIYFHYHPGELYVFTCEWNYRPDHCMYMSVCKRAELVGVYVLHGCRRVWHENKQPAFKAVYTAFKEHRLGASIQYDLLESLEQYLHKAESSNCGKVRTVFTLQIEEYIKKSHKDKS